MNHLVNITIESNVKLADVRIEVGSHFANQFDARMEIVLCVQTSKPRHGAAPIPPSTSHCQQVKF